MIFSTPQCLNPYSTGSNSNNVDKLVPPTPDMRLNPYSTGSNSNLCTVKTDKSIISLNPYSTGSNSNSFVPVSV